MTSKQIHFYEDGRGSLVLMAHSWQETEAAISGGKSMIYTNQMALLETSLFEKGYRVFVHPPDAPVYEIKLGAGNECCGRELRMGHNIFKLWRAGEFSYRGVEREA